MAIFELATHDEQKLICDTGTLNYVPDPVRNVYGNSNRLPVEDWLLMQLEFGKVRYPDHKVFTLGTSCVFGDKFVTYLTICEFDLKPDSFDELRHAVRESDQAIRRKLGSLWNWTYCMVGGSNHDRAAVFIGWLDFAYFVQNRRAFLDLNHNRFMGSFAASRPTSIDYEVKDDGSLIEFDPANLDDEHREVFNRASEIRFEVVTAGKEESRVPLRMV